MFSFDNTYGFISKRIEHLEPQYISNKMQQKQKQN